MDKDTQVAGDVCSGCGGVGWTDYGACTGCDGTGWDETAESGSWARS